MADDTEKLILDSEVPKSRALAVWLGTIFLCLIVTYFFVGSSMIGSKISDLRLGKILGFAAVTILLLAIGNRFGNQFFREVLTLKNGILTHEEHYFWLTRRSSIVRDEVDRIEIRNSPFSFIVTVVTVNGRRNICRDIARDRKEEYLCALANFAPVTPTPKAEQADAGKPDPAAS